MSEPWDVSIMVVNDNNERFLTAAIDSAFGQNHPLCEVIVVDDCSTGNSRAIIAGYGDRIRPYSERDEWPPDSRPEQRLATCAPSDPHLPRLGRSTFTACRSDHQIWTL